VLTPLPPLAAMAVVTAACGLLLGGVTLWRRRGSPPAELTRKAVHVGMGLIALSLPWLFDRPWPVLVLCGGLGLAFLALKLFARRSALGEAMHDVDRSSRGDLYFAASVAALWLLADGDRLLC
jgi:phytol kinase